MGDSIRECMYLQQRLCRMFDNITPEEFKRVIDVSLMGRVYGAMAALPHLKREGGGGADPHLSSWAGDRPLKVRTAQQARCTEGFARIPARRLQHENTHQCDE